MTNLAERQNTYHETDDDLAARLHQLFMVDEVQEVEIIHPTEGKQTLTREGYLEMAKHIKRAREMSPKERAKESRRIARRKRKRFKKMLLRAKSYIVDIEDDSTFGFDVDGKEIPIEGTIFVAIANYPKGVARLDNEMGCFVAENLRKPLSRIRSKDPLTIPGEAVETNEKRVTH